MTLPSNAVKCDDGMIAATPLLARQRWQQYFARKLAGEVTSFGQLLELSLQTNGQLHKNLPSLDGCLVPTLHNNVARLVKGKLGTAHGEDCVPVEVHKLVASDMSKLLHPLWLRAVLRLEEPLAWKGGMLQELFKGSGSKQECQTSREVFLSDDMAKEYHHWLRHAAVPVF